MLGRAPPDRAMASRGRRMVGGFRFEQRGRVNMRNAEKVRLTRRDMLKLSGAGAGLFALTASGFAVPRGIASGGPVYLEAFPTSPLILKPFTDFIESPKALAPVDSNTWDTIAGPKGSVGYHPEKARQDCLGPLKASDDKYLAKYGVPMGTHQKWSDEVPGGPSEPVYHQIKLEINGHRFTSSLVQPIDSSGKNIVHPVTKSAAPVLLPDSTIYGFNGTFPGPRINAEYGKPVCVRFENHLTDANIRGYDLQDFGAPNRSFLTHLHNGHTAPESDGQPHYSAWRFDRADRQEHYEKAFEPGEWIDQMYLGFPAGNDYKEMQSFFWFHDHVHGHTGANVYKGMVGLMPIYDPFNPAIPNSGKDPGDETKGLRLPGVRKDYANGHFDVDYDIPLALYDCRLDDGVTPHKDAHNGNGESHPEWWGKTYFRHFPNHGFVGDIFTVNGTAYPVMRVKRRKYRLRFLDASISRIYNLQFMTSQKGPVAARDLGYGGDELQGQYRLPDGQPCMKIVQIANEGGLLPTSILRDSFELWPAKRREFVIDFTRYQDGSPTTKGDVIYLTNVMKMPNGRMWSNSSRFSPDPAYKVPIMKIVIGDDAPDDSQIPQVMRPLPPLPTNWKTLMDNRLIFEVERGSAGGETEWLINGQPFDPTKVATSEKNTAGKMPLAQQKKNSFNLWEVRNGGGGWVHPMHLHMEEHRTVMRNGVDVTKGGTKAHPDDVSREDLVALDPNESVVLYRGFRDFVGPYVAHCHNLAHEDHAMMFGWEITP
jgi:FtsP/CotA-like multicopper oxidase with cupredoxin domain